MIDYNLKFKKKGERGYWNTTIYAQNDEEAIKESINYIKTREDTENIEKIKIEKMYIKYRKIYEKVFN